MKKILRYILTCQWMNTRFFLKAFLFSILIMVWQRIMGVEHITETLVLGLMGTVTALIGVKKGFEYKMKDKDGQE